MLTFIKREEVNVRFYLAFFTVTINKITTFYFYGTIERNKKTEEDEEIVINIKLIREIYIYCDVMGVVILKLKFNQHQEPDYITCVAWDSHKLFFMFYFYNTESKNVKSSNI